MSTETIEGTKHVTVPQNAEPGDHEKFAHYANKDKINNAMILGTPVTALCGKTWVPTRDPEKFPVCPECKRLFELGPEGRMKEWRERQTD